MAGHTGPGIEGTGHMAAETPGTLADRTVDRVGLLGASYGTGNLGVSALAWSSVCLIDRRWPGAEIVIIGAGRQPGETTYDLPSGDRIVTTWPARVSPSPLVANHLLSLRLSLLLRRGARGSEPASACRTTLDALRGCDVFLDITGGDSFSDIYGLRRMTINYVRKRLCQAAGRPYLLLPQTYGPYRSRLARLMARRVLGRAQRVWSRDREGLGVVDEVTGHAGAAQLCPDVAFVLEPRAASGPETEALDAARAAGETIVGCNVSGLLWSGGYTRDNQFGLRADYRTLSRDIVRRLAALDGVRVLLVPHVIPKGFSVEDDHAASQELASGLPREARERVIVAGGEYGPREVKHLIGRCDFFLGARMHSTIAALSQGIPAVGMAYSKKFRGVFETVEMEDSVIDLREEPLEDAVRRVEELFAGREARRERLARVIPGVVRRVETLLDDVGDL